MGFSRGMLTRTVARTALLALVLGGLAGPTGASAAPLALPLQAADTTPPLPVSKLTAVGRLAPDGRLAARLTWHEPGGWDVTGVHIRVREGIAPFAALEDIVGGVFSLTALITPLKPNMPYTISAYAFDAAGNNAAPVTIRIYPSRGTVAAPRVVAAGSAATVVGSLTNMQGRPLGNQLVQILVQVPGTTTWRVYRTVRTDRLGKARLAVRPTANTTFGIRFPGAVGTLGFSSGTTALVRVGPGVSARLVLARPSATNTVARRAAARLVGTVSPRAAGQPVHLQRLVGRAWRTAAVARLGATSNFAFTLPTGAAGATSYRVFRPATRAVPAVASTPVILRVR